MGNCDSTMGRWVLWATVLFAFGACSSCMPPDETTWIGFSPSDRYLAAATRQGHLTIYDLEKNKSREITANAAADGGFEWSPVGEVLAFCLRQKGQWDLALADPSGTVTLLTNDPWRDLQPTWSLDGSGIYYVSSFGGGYARDYDIRYYRLAARQSYPIIRGAHDQVEPRLSPDGRWLAAVSYRHGNPVILIYNLKTTRAVQIWPPPDFRGDPLRLLLWLADSRKLLYEIEHGGHYHLLECEVESEKSQQLDTSDHPFEALALDRERRSLFYVTGGKVYRRSTQPRWGRKQRLPFENLSVSWVAVPHRTNRLGAVVERRFLALAPASGSKVQPLLENKDQYLLWGDLELRRGHRQAGLNYYEAAMRRVREKGGPDADTEVARMKMSRAPLLCRLGYSQKTSEYLWEAQRVLEKTMDPDTRNRLYFLLALNEYVWNGRNQAARALVEKIAPEKRSSETALLLQVLHHPDKRVRQDCRRGIAALWRDKTEEGSRIFQQLLQSYPADHVVQGIYVWAWSELGTLVFENFSTLAAIEKKRIEPWAQMIVRYQEIIGERLAMNQELLNNLELALLVLHDADGLKQMILQYDRKMLRGDMVRDLYSRYWRMEQLWGEDEPALNEILVRVYFDDEVLARVAERTTDSLLRTDVRLAHARYALVEGELEKMKGVLANLGKDLEHAGADYIFGPDRQRAIAYAILEGELDEQLGAWGKAVNHYREAATEIEKRTKDEPTKTPSAEYLSRLLDGTRFRADLLERGATVRDQLTDLLAVERAVGDHLMTDSTDPTRQLAGIHNYFSLLGRLSTPWLKDLVFLKAGQSYRRLGRWCEAGFCLRVAAQSRERFVARYARLELAEFYRELEDPGLAGL